MLPRTLKELQFGTLGNHSPVQLWCGSLPDSLETLEFYRYHHPFEPGVLPSSLKSLTLNADYNHPLVEIPPNLQYLYIHINAYDIALL